MISSLQQVAVKTFPSVALYLISYSAIYTSIIILKAPAMVVPKKDKFPDHI